jgi:proton glutamate symport protein
VFKLKLHGQIFLGLAFGIFFGLFFQEYVSFLTPIADMFIRALRMIVMPLIFASLVMGVVNLGNIQHLGKIGGRTFFYYLTTTIMAVLIGLFVVNLIEPGVGAALNFNVATVPQDIQEQSKIGLASILVEIVPDNIFKAIAEGQMMPLIFFSILVGCALNLIGKKGEGFTKFVDGLNEVMLKITHWIMKLAPIGVFALMATLVGTTGFSAFKPLALFVLVVFLGLLLHTVLTLCSALVFFARLSPITFIRQMFPALATAFTTDSSLATLPVTIECLEKRVGVSNKVTSFVVPLGSTINMDGTALYESVAAVFIAQVYGIDLSIMDQVVIFVSATLTSIGAAGIPSAGLVTLLIVLRAVGLPTEGIGLVFAIDRIVDMCRTTVNVFGDAVGAAVIARTEGENF